VLSPRYPDLSTCRAFPGPTELDPGAYQGFRGTLGPGPGMRHPLVGTVGPGPGTRHALVGTDRPCLLENKKKETVGILGQTN
jgi:hypothetical protein